MKDRIKRLTEMEGCQVHSVWLPEGDGGSWTVGMNGVESITLYNETGQMAPVPYLCIRLTNGKEIRANAASYDVQIETRGTTGK